MTLERIRRHVALSAALALLMLLMCAGLRVETRALIAAQPTQGSSCDAEAAKAERASEAQYNAPNQYMGVYKFGAFSIRTLDPKYLATNPTPEELRKAADEAVRQADFYSRQAETQAARFGPNDGNIVNQLANAASYEFSACLFRLVADRLERAGSKPAPAPTTAPRSPLSPAPKPPDLNEARGRVMQGYKDVIDDVIIDLDQVPAMLKNAPPLPKSTASMKDTNIRGEDAVECLSVYWPVNPGQTPRLQNRCAFPVEALWCVKPCGKRAGNMWTIYPGDGNYDGYPIQGTENAAGRSSEIWFGGCKGRNSIGGAKDSLTYTCSPPY